MPRSRTPRYLSAAEAAAVLGVSRSSLYAYVSRGRVRAEPDPRDPRSSRYLTADVERLGDLKQARRHPETAARKNLAWGMPVLESSLTLIDDGRLFYRGEDALALARRCRFEDIVRLLWNDGDKVAANDPNVASCTQALASIRALPVMDRMQAILSFASAADRAALEVSPERNVATGWRILNLLVAAVAMRTSRRRRPIASQLADAWDASADPARRLIDTALILCADHELNVSAFAVRVVASTGSSLYNVVAAGLGALRGPRHGGHTGRVEAFLDEARSADRVRHTMAERVRRGDAIPGFGHPLYPDGDPRARALFRAVEKAWPHSETTSLLRASRRAGRELLGEHPNLDFGLVILRRALGLPRDAALVLFALGRSAGWIAHAMEQYSTEQLIRPRAKYTGPMPKQRI